MSTTIVLADDHHLVRHGLAMLLRSEPAFQIVGEAATGPEAVKLAGATRPTVLIVDLMMPGLTGIEVTRQVRRNTPEVRVAILSMHANEAFVLEALTSGALGYILKSSSPADLVKGVREVAAGRRYLSPPLSEQALAAYARRVGTGACQPAETLTQREADVLRLVAEGLTNAEIAAHLFISQRTVETHRFHLMRKLGLRNQAELIRYALRKGLTSTEA
jgi:DNA-binding NarL/FixJ family response regulator